jgi:hypothetical protein
MNRALESIKQMPSHHREKMHRIVRVDFSWAKPFWSFQMRNARARVEQNTRNLVGNTFGSLHQVLFETGERASLAKVAVATPL